MLFWRLAGASLRDNLPCYFLSDFDDQSQYH